MRKQYTGYERDKESGLDYAQARYYNSNHGRFTSVDPLTASASIRNPQTFNRYAYVLNSPYKFVDPLGLLAQGTSNNGYCGAEYSSCSGDSYDPWEDREEVPEAQETEEGVADNQNSASDSPQQEAEPAEDPPPPDTPEEIDEKLTNIFTDTGEVVGASYPPYYAVDNGEVVDNHYRFGEDGTLHTIHINGNPRGESAGVFIPSGFSSVVITSEDTVVATNPETGEVILIAHVKVGKGKAGYRKLRENMKTTRENGTVYIGEIGGKGGSGGTKASHAHLSFFPSEKARLDATNFKHAKGGIYDFQKKDVGGWVSDFRNFVR